jgi:hypothetical protein
MAEELDLNKFRRQRQERPKEPEETKEQQIERLKSEIAGYEAKLNEPSALETFLAKSPEEKELQLAEMNQSLPDEERYSVEDYINELKSASHVPDVNSVRLAVARQKLERLQSGSNE